MTSGRIPEKQRPIIDYATLPPPEEIGPPSRGRTLEDIPEYVRALVEKVYAEQVRVVQALPDQETAQEFARLCRAYGKIRQPEPLSVGIQLITGLSKDGPRYHVRVTARKKIYRKRKNGADNTVGTPVDTNNDHGAGDTGQTPAPVKTGKRH